MPYLQTLTETYDSTKIAILAISTIGSKKMSQGYVLSALMGKQATFPILLNGNQIQKAFRGRGVPNTFIIDRQGRVRYKHLGFSDAMKKFIELEIQSLLDEAG